MWHRRFVWVFFSDLEIEILLPQRLSVPEWFSPEFSDSDINSFKTWYISVEDKTMTINLYLFHTVSASLNYSKRLFSLFLFISSTEDYLDIESTGHSRSPAVSRNQSYTRKPKLSEPWMSSVSMLVSSRILFFSFFVFVPSFKEILLVPWNPQRKCL